jgi:hypothetical protein
MLASGIGFAYKAAFRATGSINRVLINVVGKRMGWDVYSWILSQIHWCIRVIYAESTEQAINMTIKVVAEAVFYAAKGTNEIAREQAQEMVRADVNEIASRNDGGLFDESFEVPNSSKIVQRRQQWAQSEIDALFAWIHSFLKSLSF